MKSQKHQSGFSTIEALLIVFVVAALVVTGLVVYQRHKSTSTKSSAATGTSQSTGQSQNSTTTQPAQATTQYLTITEWGVKLPLSNSISDAYYVPAAGSNKGADGQPNNMLVGLKSLDSSGCAATNTTAIALIFRALPTETDSGTGKLLKQEYPNGFTIGNYYYVYGKLESTTCKAPQTTIQSTDSAFATAAKGIIAATDLGYLVIKEWGIKIKLADADKITYTLGGTPNGSSGNADAIVSWATLRLTDSASSSGKCQSLGYEVDQNLGNGSQPTPGTNQVKIGKYYYGFSGGASSCGDSTVDPLRAKITGSELVTNAITAE